jgi:signal transduction histidine kinase
VLLWPVFMAGAAAFALISARRTLSLAAQGAAESVRLERTRQNLRSILHGHHDAQALLSSATLNTDLLLREVEAGPAAQRVANNLLQDLALLRQCVQGLKQRADGEIVTTLDPTEVAFDDDVRRVAEQMSPQLGAVQLVAETRAPGARALVAGGSLGLTKILLNLLLNARDAPGSHRTSRIRVETFATTTRACLTITDDGPGFPEALDDGRTARLDGMGVGLAIVAAIAEASGGSLRLGRNVPRGARVDIALPLIRTTSC